MLIGFSYPAGGYYYRRRGKPRYITGDMVKDGVVVIDVGVNRVRINEKKGFRLVGDVDFDAVKERRP